MKRFIQEPPPPNLSTDDRWREYVKETIQKKINRSMGYIRDYDLLFRPIPRRKIKSTVTIPQEAYSKALQRF